CAGVELGATFAVDQRPQQDEAAMDLGLDRALGTVERDRDLVVAEAVDVAQDDRRPVTLREPEQPRGPRPACLVAGQPVVRRLGRRGNWMVELIEERERLAGARRGPAPNPRPGDVDDDR